MKTSLSGIKAIAKREGTILHVYLDSEGYPTAGVGHLITDSEHADFTVGKKISQAQSDAWLAADLGKCEDAVNSLGVDLTQNEFDALVSLAFNIGVGAASGPHKGGFLGSTVARKLKAGDKQGAAQAILLWNKPSEIQGRRRTEYNQFLTPYKQDSATSPAASTSSGLDTSDPALSSQPSQSDPPPITTTVEQIQSQAVKTDDTTAVTQTTVTQAQPKGDPPDAPATQVAKGRWFSYIISGFGGASGVATAIWGWMGSNLNAVGIGLICLTLIILALMFRKAILDAIRMQTAADPDKYNVK